MTDITISVKDIKDVKTVSIEGIGDFEIRKPTSAESLDLMQKQRRLAMIQADLYSTGIMKLKDKKDEDLTDDDLKQLAKVATNAEKLGKEVDEINNYELAIHKRRFKDISGGDAVDKLFKTLSDEGITNIFALTFGQDTKEENKES